MSSGMVRFRIELTDAAKKRCVICRLHAGLRFELEFQERGESFDP